MTGPISKKQIGMISTGTAACDTQSHSKLSVCGMQAKAHLPLGESEGMPPMNVVLVGAF